MRSVSTCLSHLLVEVSAAFYAFDAKGSETSDRTPLWIAIRRDRCFVFPVTPKKDWRRRED